jgi:FixJ family two-component response regulator
LRVLRADDGNELIGMGHRDRMGTGAPWNAGSTAPGSDALATSTESSERSGVIKVLAVDDDDFMRVLLHRVLSDAGMQVASHASAEDLLGAEDLASATVLLLDVQMPGMSGLDLQGQLRAHGINLPIVFISGAADLSMAVTAMRNGADDFIEKPFEGDLLIESVRRAVARHADRAAMAKRPPDPLVMERFESLTPREREVFDLLVTGMSSKMIARELGGSFRTIEIHRTQVMRKMAARHLPELVRMSIESMAPRSASAR